MGERREDVELKENELPAFRTGYFRLLYEAYGGGNLQQPVALVFAFAPDARLAGERSLRYGPHPHRRVDRIAGLECGGEA